MIDFVDLTRIHNPIRKKIDQAIASVINHNHFIMGPELEKFEQEFASYCHTKYGVGVGNGTEALRLGVLALGIGVGDEVITVANTHNATAVAIAHSGAKPVLIDCDDFFEMDVSKLEKAVTKRTKAIIPVHFAGQSVQMDEVMRVAKKYGLLVIEDAAQAHGAEYKGRKVGSIGDLGCFSFYPGKNLGALGDGGMVVTNNAKIAEKVRMLRDFGQKQKYFHEILGFNSRLDSLQAAILSVKLKNLEKWNLERKQAADLYRQLLGDIVVTPKERGDGKHVYHLFIVKTPQRKKLQDFLQKKGISTVLHYPVPLHLQECFKYLGYKKGDFPVAEENSNTIISLPLYPGITKKEVNEVAAAVKQFFS